MFARLSDALRKSVGSRVLALSTGLVLLSLCLLLLADLTGLRTDGTRERQNAREATVETLAVRLSLLASVSGPAAIESAIDTFVSGAADVEGAELKRIADDARTRFGRQKVLDTHGSGLDAAHAFVPIFDGDDLWGEVDIAFRPIDPIRDDLVYFGVLALALLVTYLAYLGKALVQLDPSRAIPERVDSAFNMLVEGVVVLDEHLRVLMVNDVAAGIAGKKPAELIGGSLERWPWVRDSHWQSPWTTVLRTGLSIVDHPVRMERETTASYTLNCSLIRDDAGRPNGVMVTLNDLSAIERKNRELSGTLTKLRRSQESITRKNRELEALASQDPLTGLKNRRAVVEELAAQLRLAVDRSVPLSCIMVDIDHFKKINDTLGHAAGDEVICAVANTLVDQSRQSDTVGRIGGEEFVLVLPGTDVDEAAEIAERVRSSIERLADEVTVPVEHLSASLGVSAHEADVTALEQLLDRADQALYAAKNGGRNRVMAFDAAVMTDGTGSATPASAESGAEPGRELELERMLKEKSKDLDALRTFEPSTGMPRRDVFVERVAEGIGEASRSGRSLVLLSLGLRDGERLTASLGHPASAQLLREFTGRLSEGFRSADTISEIAGGYSLSHVGTSEFGVLLENVTDSAQVLTIMTRVRRLFSTPIVVDGTRVHVGCSMGAAFHPRDGDTAETLIEQAGKARVEAARQPDRTALRFAGDGAAAPTRESLEMESDLYEALERGQLSVNYQPKLELASQRIAGMEALVRWLHPEKGSISPADFIPLAERSGLIEDISTFVMKTSLDQLARWHRAGFDDLGMAMNVSAAQLRNPELVPNILGALEAAGVSPEHVEVELTETSVIESPQRARIALGQLRSAGISVSMDDFGTGYTSLALLADLPLDSVKIDRSFVDAMQGNERSRAVVRSIVNMGRTLGLSVIGEGVETNEQLAMLAAFGCNDVQGYLISRPLDADGMTEFLERQARDRQPRKQA